MSLTLLCSRKRYGFKCSCSNALVGELPHSGFCPSGWASDHALCSHRMLKRPSGAPLASSTQLQGISTARGIPLKLHQSDNSDHTKRQFEFVTRLGQSPISNYAESTLPSGALPSLCPVRLPGQNVVSVNLKVKY
jgi:hypothetical protein